MWPSAAGAQAVRVATLVVEARCRHLEETGVVEIAAQPAGVREAFAIQAGREVRVIVDAKRVDDSIAAKIARDVAKEIENKLTYPGEIRVTVLRELRVVARAR